MNSRIKAKLIQFFHHALTTLVSGEDDKYRDLWQWRWLGWDSIPWPWQVGSGGETLYLRILQARVGRGNHVLILGATPALRAMAAETGTEVVCADFSLPMLLRMGRYVEKRVPGATEKEIWFRGDWFRIPFPENYFDIVFGDNVLLFVSPAAQHSFLQRISRTVKPGGFFVTRTRIVDERLQNLTPTDIFDEFWRRFPTMGKRELAMLYLSFLLLDWSWDIETGKTSRQKLAEAAAAYRRSVPQKERRLFLDAFLRDHGVGMDFYFSKEKELEDVLGRHFKIVEKLYAEAPPSSPMADFVRLFPTYLLQKADL